MVAEHSPIVKDSRKIWPFYKLDRDLGYDHSGYCAETVELFMDLELEFGIDASDVLDTPPSREGFTVEQVYFLVKGKIEAKGEQAQIEAGLLPSKPVASNLISYDLGRR